MRKKITKTIALLTSVVMAVGVILTVPSHRAEAASEAASAESVPIFRLYNPNSGEHFYTSDESERETLKKAGWWYEKIGWFAPKSSNTPVYRLYSYTGEHHYTTDAGEKDDLINRGWRDEGIAWYSDDKKSVSIYRDCNPNVNVGTHNYTASKSEHDNLVLLGWKDEGIGWYGLDTVILGTYEQDNDPSNGPEPIEWQVVGIRNGHILLLSKYVLDCKKYNETNTGITWEDCTLRTWLNNDFYNTAFPDDDEKKDDKDDVKDWIATAHNENPDSYELYRRWSTSYGAKGGNATNDNVFLLDTPIKDTSSTTPFVVIWIVQF